MLVLGVPRGFVHAVTSIAENPNVIILLLIGILIAAVCVMITAFGVNFIATSLGFNLFVVFGLTGDSTLKIVARAETFIFFMLPMVLLLLDYTPHISIVLQTHSVQVKSCLQVFSPLHCDTRGSWQLSTRAPRVKRFV